MRVKYCVNAGFVLKHFNLEHALHCMKVLRRDRDESLAEGKVDHSRYHPCKIKTVEKMNE